MRTSVGRLLLALALAPGCAARRAPSPTEEAAAGRPSDDAGIVRSVETVRSRTLRLLLEEALVQREAGEHAKSRATLARGLDDSTDDDPSPWTPEEIDRLAQLGTLALAGGDLATARLARARVVQLLEAASHPDGEDLTDARSKLAEILARQGEYSASRQLFEQVVAALERTRAPDHRDLLTARANLAVVLRFAGDAQAALAIEAEVLAARERTLPPDDPDLASSRFNLAVTRKALGDARGALELEEQAVAHLGRILSPDDPDLAMARRSLGRTLQATGDFARSRLLLEQALEVFGERFPGDHDQVTGTRADLGFTLFKQGELGAAREIQERLVAQFETTRPEDDLDLARARDRLGLTVGLLGDHQLARVLQEQALAACEAGLPPDDEDLASVRGSLAGTLLELGETRRARELQEQVLATYEHTRGVGGVEVAAACVNLAGTLRVLGETQAARALCERGLEIYERALPADHLDLAGARMSAAGIAWALGDLETAREGFEEVVAVYARRLPPNHPHLAHARANLAVTLQILGDLPRARGLLEQSIASIEAAGGPDHPGLAVPRGSLALLLRSLGDKAAARELQEWVLTVLSRELPADHDDVVKARGNLANTLRDLGELEAARSLQQEVLSTFESRFPVGSPEVARARWNLATTLKELGDLQAARELQEQALAQANLPEGHPDLTAMRAMMALILKEQGDRAGARALEEGALAQFERTLPGDSRALSAIRRNLALTLLGLLGESRDAGGTNRIELESALDRIGVQLAQGLMERTRSALLSASPREAEERVASQLEELEQLLALCLGHGIFEPSSALRARVFEASESMRGASEVAARLASLPADDAESVALRQLIAEESSALARHGMSGSSGEELARTRSALDAAGRELALRAAAGLGTDSLLEPDLESFEQVLGADEVLVAWRRSRVWNFGPGLEEPVVEAPEHLLAWVLGSRRSGTTTNADADRGLRMVDLGPLAPIRSVVEQWKAEIGAGRERGLGTPPQSAREDLMTEIRARILDPLRSACGGARRLVVVLDDVLHAVPLDALPAGEPWGGQETGALLGDAIVIEVRSSLVERLLPDVRREVAGQLLACGDPAFDAQPADLAQPDGPAVPRHDDQAGLLRGGPWARGFETLPETQREVRGVRRYFEDAFGEHMPATVLERTRASREAFLELAPTARWLHVATHGWFAPESVRAFTDPIQPREDPLAGVRMDATERVRGMSPMLLCGLAFAGANLPVDSVGRIPGLITAQEIAALDLGSCELAVLSACDTNVGITSAGRGVASLQRALHMAGARSAITSLWRVPDEPTRELMLEFYRRIWVLKESKHAALWGAKSKLRSAKDERGNPRYSIRDWAGWVLTGDPN